MRFQDIKVGDIVGCPSRGRNYGGNRPYVQYHKLTVTRVTATQFACGPSRFKKDGYVIGGGYVQAVPWTTELDEQHTEQVTVQRLYDRVTEGLEALLGMHRRNELNVQVQRQLDAALNLARSAESLVKAGD